MKDVLDNLANMSTYDDSQGVSALKEALYQARGGLCHPNQILVDSNYQSLLFFLCGLFENRHYYWYRFSGKTCFQII